LNIVGFLKDDANQGNSTAIVLNVLKSYDAAIFKALVDNRNGLFRSGAVYIDTAFGAFQLSNIEVSGDIKDNFYLQGISLSYK
jgi:hypothetical protein